MSGAEGIFRFREELPDVDARISLGEGSTPVIRLSSIGRTLGIANLYAKIEGSNPTGSFKDRVAAMSMSLAISQGRTRWIATSSGNAGIALAAYGSRAGLGGFFCVGRDIPEEKLLPILAFGTRVIRVSGISRDVSHQQEDALLATVVEASKRHALFLGTTAHRFNPQGMRGADTIAYEICEAPIDPAVVYVPAGGGGLATAIGRGAHEIGSGLSVVVVQPAGCAPIAGTLAGLLPEPSIAGSDTAISSLSLAAPPDGDLAVRAVRESGGWGVLQSDSQIFEAQRMLARDEGILVEAASATALAGVLCDLQAGRLSRDATAVVVLTANGFKSPSNGAESATAPVVEISDLATAISEWVA